MRKTRTLSQNSGRCRCRLDVRSSGPPNDSQITGHGLVLVLVLVLVGNTAEMEELLVLPGLCGHTADNIVFKEPVQSHQGVHDVT